MNTTLAIGDFVSCSNGTPQPPAHHKRKLARWKFDNFTGWVHSIDEKFNRIGIDESGSKVLVRMMNTATHTITKASPPTSASSGTAVTPPSIKPQASGITHHKKQHSPWGNVDDWSPFGDQGLYQHSTPSHGGVYVPEEMKRMMPAPYRNANAYGGGCWFEEDSEWALVALSFPSGHSEKNIKAAISTVKNYYPHQYMAVTGEKLSRHDSSVLAKEEDRASAVGKYVADCAWGHGNNNADRIDVPPGMVGVSATIGGRDENYHCNEASRRYFLVPSEEYETRTSFGFIMHKDYPEWHKIGEAPKPSRMTPENIASARALLECAA